MTRKLPGRTLKLLENRYIGLPSASKSFECSFPPLDFPEIVQEERVCLVNPGGYYHYLIIAATINRRGHLYDLLLESAGIQQISEDAVRANFKTLLQSIGPD